jgi:hypothetical protein
VPSATPAAVADGQRVLGYAALSLRAILSTEKSAAAYKLRAATLISARILDRWRGGRSSVRRSNFQLSPKLKFQTETAKDLPEPNLRR